MDLFRVRVRTVGSRVVAYGDGLNVSLDVYRSLGPLIEVNVRLGYEDTQSSWFTPSATCSFAVGLIRVCSYAFLFKLKLIARDLWTWIFSR